MRGIPSWEGVGRFFFDTFSITIRALTVTLLISMLQGCGKPDAVPPDARPWTAFVEDLITYDHLPILNDASIRMVSSSDPRGGNNDFNNFQGRSRDAGWVVLLDEEGPGVVRRFWMTGTDKGHEVRVYIDGERDPRLEGPLEEVFGHMPPWLPPLAQYKNICFYSYVPIPFHRSIRIETQEPNMDPRWGLRRIFYQISVETLPEDQAVESYPATFTQEQLAVAERVRERWTAVLNARDIPFLEDASYMLIPSSERRIVLEHDGPANLMAWHIHARPETPDEWSVIEQEYLLQDTVLRVYYDGQESPSVASPIGDFFSNAWRKRELGNLWMTSGSNGYSFRLPMPFRKSIRFEIENGADRNILVTLVPEWGEYPGEQAGYLHAEWRRTGPDTVEDHFITEINGRGKFLGCFLGITGKDPSWWILEGDERMWVDDAQTPTWDGTGLEDYFNGGWYYRGAVFGALSASFDRAPFRVAQYRHQHPDPVSFQRNFRMNFERIRYPQTGAPVQGYFQSVAYLYMEQPTPVPDTPGDREARRAVEHDHYRPTFMLQLVELERANDFVSAMRAIDEYRERFPDAEENGVLLLRHVEYLRLLGESVSDADYQPFLDGAHGETAQQQAQLLSWFYAHEMRALVGMHVNGLGQLYLNGQMILTGDHPYNLFVAGVTLEPGPYQLAARVEARRSAEWYQVGIRTHDGIVGTGPGTYASEELISGWRTGRVQTPPWQLMTNRDLVRGVPDAPYIGGIPNAFILIQSKAFPLRTPHWGVQVTPTAYFRTDFTVPLEGWPTFTRMVTGLAE